MREKAKDQSFLDDAAQDPKEDRQSSEDGLSPPRRPWRLPRKAITLLGLLAAATLIALYFYSSNENSGRCELRCSSGVVEARRGLYFPFGTKQIADDAHDPLELPEGMSCASARMATLEELDHTLANLLLESAEHRLQQGGLEMLALARQNVERSRRLQGIDEDQRRRADSLLADMAYHEARELLRQIERDLWQARGKLERAKSLGASKRLGDLDEWLRFVEGETERFRPAPQTDLSDVDDEATPPAPPPEPQQPLSRQEDVFL